MTDNLQPGDWISSQGDEVIVVGEPRYIQMDLMSMSDKIRCCDGRQFLSAGLIVGRNDNAYVQFRICHFKIPHFGEVMVRQIVSGDGTYRLMACRA